MPKGESLMALFLVTDEVAQAAYFYAFWKEVTGYP